MRWIQRLKNDKSYRRKTILIVIVVILMIAINGNQSKKTASFALCDSKNLNVCGEGNEHGQDRCLISWDPTSITISGAFTGEAQNKCWEADCAVAVWQGGITHDAHCFNEVPNGWIVKKKSDCESGEGSIINEYIICREAQEGERCEKDYEKMFAKFLDSVWATNPFTCKQRFYVVAGMGALLFMNMI